ncbi:MAG: DNA gyrase subunit A [Caudoviricetes sp.]|nr:MAG: DNA gyrase subunit A [Caudoviricetes sp.]
MSYSELKNELGINFINYAMAVNSDRSLPDAKTGLKPVARRILYSTMMKGRVSSKPHVKSARIVGDVMGELHPHGQDAIYGALVRLGQEWIMRYPLINIHGNAGNIDGDSPAAMRYCVTGDTLIITDKGTIPIKDLKKYANNEDLKDIKIKDFKGNYVPATKFFDSGKHPIKKLILKNGLTIKGTYNHPLMVLDEECNYKWKTLEQINITDKILIPHFEDNSYNNFNKDKASLEAKMLGCMVSEGYIATQNKIGLNNTNLEMIQPVYDFIQTKIKNSASINYNKNRGYYEYCIADKEYFPIFINEYDYKKEAKDKIIPKQVWNGTKEDKAGFLSYLFEGDGSISLCGKSYKIDYSTYSEKLAHQIQIMLLQDFNIFSSISYTKSRKEYKITISSIGIVKFKNWIGFISDRKNEILITATKSILEKKKCPSNSYYNIVEISKYIRKLNNNNFTSKHSMSNIFNFDLSKEHINAGTFSRLKNLISNYLYIPVKDIIDLEEEETVYSIRVDNKDSDHSFIANGFINHNTESRLTKLAEEGLLQGIKKKNVDFVPNYDEQDEEPITLPAIFPNLLCNPNSGIGVAMATHFLPHNLKEVAQAIFNYIDNKDIGILPPDFPTGGIIINKNDIPNIMKSGRGSIKIRGKYKIEKSNIIFYEIPYEVSTEAILNDIGNACDNGKIVGISDVRNESNKKGIRIVIECKKEVNPENIVKLLFAKTCLQTSISYNQVALVDGVPTELNLEDCIKIYINHNIDCLIKETNFDLNKAKDRSEIVEGLLKALEDIDNIIKLIKESENSNKARENLIKKYGFSESQSKAIVDMRLGKLAGLEKIELQQENKNLNAEIEKLNKILSSKEVQTKVIKDRLSYIVNKYGDERRTEVLQLKESKVDEKESIIPEDAVVVLTQTGNIKRIPKVSFKKQRRNGKGIKSKSEAILTTISTNTIDSLFLFSSKGKMYRLLVDKIPQGTNISKGININSLLDMESDEEVIAATSLNDDIKAKYIVFFTKKGLFKKTLLEEYLKVKKNKGIAAIKLREGDSIANAAFMNEEEVFLITKKGMSIRFATKDIKPIGRDTSGVKSINLYDNDEVLIGLPIVSEKENIAIFISNGIGKKCRLFDFSIQGRGGRGVLISNLKDCDCTLTGAAMVNDKDSLLLNGRNNTICIGAEEIPLLSRNGNGNLMMKGEIVSVVKL